MKTGVFFAIILPLLLFLALTTIAHASTITVDDNLKECPSADYASIQEAIDNASSGDGSQL